MDGQCRSPAQTTIGGKPSTRRRTADRRTAYAARLRKGEKQDQAPA